MKKIKKRGTFQKKGWWLIPHAIGISVINMNYEYNLYVLQVLMFQISFRMNRLQMIPDPDNILEKARYFAYKWHRETNHYYGKGENEVPYEKHLEMVEAEARNFLYLIPEKFHLLILAACLLHDSIEDARVTYNDVKEALGVELADFAYALSNEKGKNRKERANAKYYAGIRDLEFATFVKLCDRLANVRYSLSPAGGRMADGYRKENPGFVKELFDENYNDMFKTLNALLS